MKLIERRYIRCEAHNALFRLLIHRFHFRYNVVYLFV